MTTSVVKFLDDARVMVKMLQMSSVNGICRICQDISGAVFAEVGVPILKDVSS